MVVIAEPITQKETHIINGLIKQLHETVASNPEVYNKPFKIMDTKLANLIYEHGLKILRPLYDSVDKYPVTCIVLVGGLVKLGVIRNFFKEQNRGKIDFMVEEFKDFYTEHCIINLIKQIEKDTAGTQMLLSRIKHKDVQEIISLDLKYLVYPIFKTIDECPMTCISLIYELVVKHKLKQIYDKSDFFNVDRMVQKYKDFYIVNRVKFLVEMLSSLPTGSESQPLPERQEAFSELSKYGVKAVKPIYEIIDDYKLTCINIIPLILKPNPFRSENFRIKRDGKGHMDIDGLVEDFKNWYKENGVIHSKPII